MRVLHAEGLGSVPSTTRGSDPGIAPRIAGVAQKLEMRDGSHLFLGWNGLLGLPALSSHTWLEVALTLTCCGHSRMVPKPAGTAAGTPQPCVCVWATPGRGQRGVPGATRWLQPACIVLPRLWTQLPAPCSLLFVFWGHIWQ